MNLVDYDGLINHFIDLLQKYSKEANRWEDRYDNYALGKAAAYLDIVTTLIELKNEVEDLPHDTR
jgi:hypothetical protein